MISLFHFQWVNINACDIMVDPKYGMTIHYRSSGLCRMSGSLPSAFCRTLDKDSFAESRTRQSPTLGNEVVHRVQDTRYWRTLGKNFFAECRTLGKGGARQRAVNGHLKLTAVNLYRVPTSWHSAKTAVSSVFSGHSAKYIFIFKILATKLFVVCSYTM
jgi:hypothetical protein